MPRARQIEGVVRAAALLAGACLLVACGGEASPAPTPTPSLTATATVPPTPRPTSTPLPTPAPLAVSGRVITRLTVSCEVGDLGVELRVRYGSSIENTDSDEARLTRMRVYIDGSLREDSGAVSAQRYVRETSFPAPGSRLHSVQLRIDTRAAPKPADVVQLVQCPPAPGYTAGVRLAQEPSSRDTIQARHGVRASEESGCRGDVILSGAKNLRSPDRRRPHVISGGVA
jgi:hypothetical protein